MVGVRGDASETREDIGIVDKIRKSRKGEGKTWFIESLLFFTPPPILPLLSNWISKKIARAEKQWDGYSRMTYQIPRRRLGDSLNGKCLWTSIQVPIRYSISMPPNLRTCPGRDMRDRDQMTGWPVLPLAEVISVPHKLEMKLMHEQRGY
jgi:hypothetical protein